MPNLDKTGPYTGTGPGTGKYRWGGCKPVKKGSVGQLTEPVTLAEALRDLAPTIRIMSRQYQKAAPLIDWLIDNYWLAIIGLGALVFGAAALGAWYGSKQ